MSRLICALGCSAVLCGVALLVGALGADDHHHGSKLLGKNLKTDGTHHIHTVADHKIHATAKGGKVHGMHATKGERKVDPTKHVKSKRQHHTGFDAAGDYHFVSAGAAALDADDCQDVVFIGFIFNLGNQIFIFWFLPVEVAPAVINVCVAYP